MHPKLRHTLLLHPVPGKARQSEGSVARRHDGSLLFVYTRFSDRSHDDAEACLVSRCSMDGGRTWSQQEVPVVTSEAGQNVMSVSLLRLQDGRLALWYLLKESRQSWRVLQRFSEDDGETWGEAASCSPEPGLYVLNNDRAVQLASGRLILPVAWRSPAEGRPADEAAIGCLLSDDNGEQWRFSRDRLSVPGVWTQEPGVVELRDGRLLLWCRTQVGCQWVSDSSDGGESWAPLQPSAFVSTLSPASLKRLPDGRLLMIWNRLDQPWTDWDALQRSPLHAATSRDEGLTWSPPIVLEEDPERWFCYSAFIACGDDLVLGYTAGSGRTHQRMATLQLATLPIEALP